MQRGDLVRGYEFKRDHYLILTDEDFESVRVESSTALVINKFVPNESIDPVYFEASYWVAPDGDAGQDVFVVLRDAIAKTGRMALSRVVISRREWAVGIRPMGRGLATHALYQPKDLTQPDELREDLPAQKPDPEMVGLATQLIVRQPGTYDQSDAEDRYEARLRELITAKLKGQGLSTEPEPEPDRSNVIDLMAALKQSLAEAKGASAPSRTHGAGAAPLEPKPAAKSAASKRRWAH